MPPVAAGDAEAQAIFAAAAMAVLHHEEYRRRQQQMMPSNYAELYGIAQRPLPPPLPSTHMTPPTFGDAAPGAPALNVQPPRAGSPQLPYQQQQTPHQQLAEQFGVGQWSTSLFACLVDPASAIDAFLCFRCQASRQRNVILNGANDLDCNTLCFTLAADIMLAIVGLPSLAQVLLVAEIRRTLRTRYGIAGTTGRDFTAAVCCHCCVLAQHYREMSVRGEWPAGECVTRPFLNGVVDLQNMV
jgi:Cys-rich protein (TIGR01571 family)